MAEAFDMEQAWEATREEIFDPSEIAKVAMWPLVNKLWPQGGDWLTDSRYKQELVIPGWGVDKDGREREIKLSAISTKYKDEDAEDTEDTDSPNALVREVTLVIEEDTGPAGHMLIENYKERWKEILQRVIAESDDEDGEDQEDRFDQMWPIEEESDQVLVRSGIAYHFDDTGYSSIQQYLQVDSANDDEVWVEIKTSLDTEHDVPLRSHDIDNLKFALKVLRQPELIPALEELKPLESDSSGRA